MEVNKKEDVEAAQNEAKNYKLPERPSNTNEKNYKLDTANVDMKNVNPMEMEKGVSSDKNSSGTHCATISRNLVTHHCKIFWLGLLLIFVLTAIGGAKMQIAENVGPNYDFTPEDHPAVENFDAISAADKKLDSLTGSDKPLERSSGDLNYGFMQFLYKSIKTDQDIFTAKNLKQICTYEQQFYNHKDYDDYCTLTYPTGCKNTTCASCMAPALSVAHIFYGATFVDYTTLSSLASGGNGPAIQQKFMLDAMNDYYYDYTHDSKLYKVSSMSMITRGDFNFSKCDSLDEWKVKATREWLYDQAGKKEITFPMNVAPPMSGKQLYGYFIDKETLTRNPKATFSSRSLLQLGSPPKGFIDSNDKVDEQREHFFKFFKVVQEFLFERFNSVTTPFKSPYRQLNTDDGDLNVKWMSLLLFNKDAGATANNDFSMVMFSVLFVYFYISVHTGSFFYGSIGILQIMLSIPVSFFFYYYVFQITYFAQTHILAVFIILGVGADDVFVLVDAWKQSEIEIEKPQDGNESDPAYLTKRMGYAYHRTYRAVLNTSLTTAMAFVGTGISPLMGFSTFGWFAAICIVMNYVYVITFTPAALLIRELYIRPFMDKHVGKCIPFCKKKVTPVAVKGDNNEAKASGCLEKVYVPLMTKSVGGKKWLKPLPIFIIVILVANTIQATIFTAQLTPPTEEEEWVKEDHMMSDWTGKTRGVFYGDEDNTYLQGRFVIGIKDIDRAGFDKYDTLSTFRGNPVYDDEFDVSSEAAQKYLLNFCTTLETYKCKDGIAGCNSEQMLARTGSVRCWIREFQEWHLSTYSNATTYGLTKAVFLERLLLFRKTEKPKAANLETWKDSIGFIDGKLKFVSIKLRTTIAPFDPQGVKHPVYLIYNEIAEEFRKDAPAGLKSIMHESSFFGWVFMSTEMALVQSLFNGLAFSFPIAALVLIYATQNILLSFYAIFSVGSVVVSVLVFCKLYMGWNLGVTETFAGIIVVGLAVDYVVHQAHMYEDAAHCEYHYQTREERFKHSATKMGSTVIAGAITTAGSGSFMFLCQLGFFFKMAVLIVVTIMFSFIYSLGLFLSLCVVMGPEGTFGNLPKVNCGKKEK